MTTSILMGRASTLPHTCCCCSFQVASLRFLSDIPRCDPPLRSSLFISADPLRQPFRPNLDFKSVLEDRDKTIANAAFRESKNFNFDYMNDLYQKYSILDREETDLLIHKQDMIDKSQDTNDSQMSHLMETDVKLADLRSRIRKIEPLLYEEALKVPNLTSPQTGVKKKVIEEVGRVRDFHFHPQDHVSLGEELRLIRQNAMMHVGPQKSYYLSGYGTLLERALVRYAEDRILQKGFIPMSVPQIVTPKVLEGCGMLPESSHTQVFRLDPHRHSYLKEPLYLIGTSEHPLVSFFLGARLTPSSLPIKLSSTSVCYRSELTLGKQARGIFRVHQFHKVEMVGLCDGQEHSEELFSQFVDIEKELFSGLEIPFRIVEIPANDLGDAVYRKIDMEAWMPGRGSYGEISSCSNCTDYQSRRLNINIKGDHHYRRPCFTVNATAMAVPRMIISILENFQNEDMSVTVPPVLRPYMNGMKTITRNEYKRIRNVKFPKISTKKNPKYLSKTCTEEV